jgi:hypothetical protein
VIARDGDRNKEIMIGKVWKESEKQKENIVYDFDVDFPAL